VETPSLALILAYWLHMLATVVWIGGLASLSLFVLPSARKTLPPVGYAAFLESLRKRLDPWGWFSLALLLGTGMFQMSANPNYNGFLSIDSRWAGAMLIKHILFGLMAAISAYITWFLLPQLSRLALRRARLEDGTASNEMAAEQGTLFRCETWLLRINLLFGILVLVLTAVARAS
jgi:uncharacterized membrane protein